MNDIKIFENPEFGSVRTTEVNGEPYFVGKDVAEILGYSNTRDALARHVDDEDKGVVKCDTLGGTQELTIINESGLYSLILSSKLPSAKQFKRWVTSEVLPSIRKTGAYAAPDTSSRNRSKSVDAMLLNAKVRMSNQLLKLAAVDTLSKQYKNILVAKAAEVLTGEQVLELPKSEQKMYSAAEIGKMFGITPQRVGSIANKNCMKTDEYGEWYRDKSPYSSKEVDAFRYNDKAIERFRQLIDTRPTE